MVIEEKTWLAIGRTAIRKTTMISNDNTAYNIYDYKNNYILIFNHKSVVAQEERKGTEIDEEALDTTFKYFGFDVRTKPDPTKNETMNILKEFFKQDLKDCGCVIVAVFTHGIMNSILYASDGKWYDIKDILEYFNHEDLVGKPKILIVQACRGTESTKGFAVNTRSKASAIKADSGPATANIMPNNVLILHSTSQNKPAYRIETEGSWFIQTLCQVLRDSIDQDLLSNVVEVKRKIAIDYDEAPYAKKPISFSEQQPPIYKQVPETTSTLTKRVYFKMTNKSVLTRDTRVRYAPSTSVEIACDSVVRQNREYVRRYSGVQTVDHVEAGSSRSTDAHTHYYSYINNCLGYYLQDNPEDEFAQYLSQIWTERKEAISLWSNLVSEYLQTKNLDYFYPCTFVIYGDGLEYFLRT